jgi:hypothetical protein
MRVLAGSGRRRQLTMSVDGGNTVAKLPLSRKGRLPFA